MNTRDRAAFFLAHSVEPQPELAAELEAARAGDAGALARLEERFGGEIAFGTAGLRGLVGYGSLRMNRDVVIRATSGLLAYLASSVPDAKTRGVVLGRDARHGSAAFQEAAAEVALAADFRVHWLEGPRPTPLVAYGVQALKAAAGVCITASHNPAAYNGYKVYWENGAQIAPPVDAGISAAIQEAPPACEVPRLTRDRAPADLWVAQDTLHEDYLKALQGVCLLPEAPVQALRIAYSAMHGVGGELCLRALRDRGFEAIASVAEQAEPDPDFPTVAFPNPEEPGAMERVLKLAAEEDSDLVLVNDPDADRLAAAVRLGDGRYRRLSGDETGLLLADHLLQHDRQGGKDRLVVTTVVSSQQLAKLAARAGVHYLETLTGFKWIANEGMRLEKEAGLRFVLGYEEAIGYAPGSLVRDKDGIQSAVRLAEAAAILKAQGQSLVDRLAEIQAEIGLYRQRQVAVVREGQAGQAAILRAMKALRSIPPKGALAVKDYLDAPEPRLKTNLLVFRMAGGSRVAVRPSGTEPKLKFYLEAMAETAAEAEAALDRLEAAVLERAGL